MVMHKLFTINYLELRGWALISHDYNGFRNIIPEIHIAYSTLVVLLTDLYEIIQNQNKGAGMISS